MNTASILYYVTVSINEEWLLQQSRFVCGILSIDVICNCKLCHPICHKQ